jgi:PAS domain S-box-containing protein
MLLLSGDGLILAANLAMQEQLGVRPEELPGRNLSDLVAEPLDELARYLGACSRSREMVSAALALRGRDGVTKAFRAEGALVAPRTASSAAMVMLRLTPQGPAAGQVIDLNQRIEELGQEVLRRKQAEKTARQEEERLRVTLQSIGDAVIVIDLDGRVSSMNPVAEALTGWRSQEAVGRPLKEVFHILNEYTRKEVENPALLALAVNIRRGLANHTLLIARDGSERPIDDSAALIQGEQGGAIGAVLVFRDITERRRLEQARAEQLRTAHLLASIVESSDDAIVSKSLDGTIRSWNNAAERIFGCTAEQAIGRHISLIIPPERAAEEDQIVARLLAGERVDHFDTVRVRSDGRPVQVSLTISPIHDEAGVVIGASKTARDITERKRMEAALRTSEAQFRQIADALPQIVWTARRDGYIDYYNERWYEYTGLPRGEYGQPSWGPILHPDDVERCVETYFGCIRAEVPYQIEYRFKDRQTGGYRWFLGRAVPVRDEEGKVVRWFGTCTDIDDTKKAEQKMKFLADASAELAELTDPDSTLQRVAAVSVPAFADWCALALVDEQGTRRRTALRHSDPSKARLGEAILERYPPRPTDPYGLSRTLRTGEAVLVEDIRDDMLAGLAHDGDHLEKLRALGLKSYLCVPMLFRERTLGALSFVMAESSRRFDAADLEVAKELAHRSAVAIENARLYRALQEEDRRKTEFLAMLAHELRNPLAPLRNGLEIMRLAGAGPQGAAAVEQARAMMERQLHQLVRLVYDLLDVNRISLGKVQLQKDRGPLAAIVSSTLETWGPVIQQAGQELTVNLPSEPLYVEADRVRLAQCLGNLLSNAAKYTHQGGHIWLTVRRDATDAVISVKDTGAGIPAHMLPKVFDLFTQVDNTLEKSQGGLGIGLTMVKRLVEMHGGRVEAHSDGPGQGSEFLIRLPIALEQSDGPKAGAGLAHRQARHRILVVDDNADSANSLAMLLQVMGQEVRTAHDGLEGIEVAELFHPEMILLDIGMPKLNGYDTCRRLRKQPWARNVTVAAVTGWGQAEDRRRSLEAGFDEHLVKPVEPAALERLLAGLHAGEG